MLAGVSIFFVQFEQYPTGSVQVITWAKCILANLETSRIERILKPAICQTSCFMCNLKNDNNKIILICNSMFMSNKLQTCINPCHEVIHITFHKVNFLDLPFWKSVHATNRCISASPWGATPVIDRKVGLADFKPPFLFNKIKKQNSSLLGVWSLYNIISPLHFIVCLSLTEEDEAQGYFRLHAVHC